MVRVNYPPGGAMNVQAESVRQPKTVRILKPPGGDCSISFSDSSPTTDSRPLPVETVCSPSTDVPEPSYESKQAEVQDEGPIKDNVDAPLQENDIQGKTFESQTVEPTPSDKKDVSEAEHCENPQEKVETSTACDTENVSNVSVDISVVSDTSAEAASESETTSVCQTTTSSTEEVSVSTSSTEESHHVSEEVSSTKENGVHTVNGSFEKTKTENGTIEKNGIDENSAQAHSSRDSAKSSNLAPLEIHPNEASVTEPLSPATTTLCSPLKPIEDTRHRVFGQPSAIPTPQPVQQRKIVDHMRSNIFMNDSDQDFYPTRTSRQSAPAPTPAPAPNAKQEVPAAGQRQRIPPGGFSTKLW